jgi:hypothetical protein
MPSNSSSPPIYFTVNYIDKELEEEFREDFFRLKRVNDNKKAKKLEDALHAHQRANAEASVAGRSGEMHMGN